MIILLLTITFAISGISVMASYDKKGLKHASFVVSSLVFLVSAVSLLQVAFTY